MTTDTPDKLRLRAQKKALKRSEKKDQIAASAQSALQELGYANTSLRDIAARAGISLGSLHYYFEDRTALILYCVKAYKAEFSDKLRDAIAGVTGRQAVIAAFASALASTIVNDASTHRLWYDIRGQALFDPAFRPLVGEVEQLLIEVIDTAISKAGGIQALTGDQAYALIDGLFRFRMQGEINGESIALETLVEEIQTTLERVF